MRGGKIWICGFQAYITTHSAYLSDQSKWQLPMLLQDSQGGSLGGSAAKSTTQAAMAVMIQVSLQGWFPCHDHGCGHWAEIA